MKIRILLFCVLWTSFSVGYSASFNDAELQTFDEAELQRVIEEKRAKEAEEFKEASDPILGLLKNKSDATLLEDSPASIETFSRGAYWKRQSLSALAFVLPLIGTFGVTIYFNMQSELDSHRLFEMLYKEIDLSVPELTKNQLTPDLRMSETELAALDAKKKTIRLEFENKYKNDIDSFFRNKSYGPTTRRVIVSDALFHVSREQKRKNS